MDNNWEVIKGKLYTRRPIKRIYVHTLGANRDSTVDKIRNYHVKHKGWKDIGYHFVVRMDGEVQIGRPVGRSGAGVLHDNRNTIHVCFTGHGDLAPWTSEQSANGITLLAMLLETYEIHSTERIWGHREYWENMNAISKKSCPGKLINMMDVRHDVRSALELEIDESDYPDESWV